MRLLAFFIAAQFLNVQVQSAFATEAMVHQNEEAQAVLAVAKEKLATRLERMGLTAAEKLAYRLYRKDIRLVNRASKSLESSEEDLALNQDLQEESDSFEIFNSEEKAPVAAPAEMNLSTRQQHIEQVITHARPLLVALGAEMKDSGDLQATDFHTFKAKLETLKTRNDLRAPASDSDVGGIILKVILTLIVVAVGLAGLLFVFAMFAFGSTSPILYLILVGVLVGEFFALKGIFASANPARGLLEPSANCA